MIVNLELRNGNEGHVEYKYNDIINSNVIFQFHKTAEITITDIPEGQEDNISRFVFNCVDIYEKQEQNQELFKNMKEGK